MTKSIWLMELNGRGINKSSLSVDGIDTRDYPDFCDAYFEYGLFVDGTELTDDELEELGDKYRDVLHETVFNQLF